MATRGIGRFWRLLTVVIVKPPLFLLTRRTWHGAAHLDTPGGVIVVVNHLSHFDPLVVSHFVYDAGRWPQFLAKQSVFDVPVLGWLLRRLKQIPVRRGTVDAARALDAAINAVKAGDAVVIYPEGTNTKQPDLWPMRARTGVARLWHATGAPVVPVVTWGPQRIFHPHTKKLRLRPRTPVTVVAGPPIEFEGYRRDQPLSSTAMQEITELVMLRLRDLLAQVRGEPAPPLFAPGRPAANTPSPGGAGTPPADRPPADRPPAGGPGEAR